MPSINGHSFRGHIGNAGGVNVKLNGPGPKQKARNNKHELKRAMQDEITNIRQSEHLSESEKDAKIKKLEKGIKNLDKPKGNLAVDYNDALSTLQAAHKARKQAKEKNLQTGNVKVEGQIQTDPPEIKSDDGGGKDGEGMSDAFKNFDEEKFANLMMEDPQAAYKQPDNMKMEEKSMAMRTTQQHIQEVQQMAQLHSNLSKVSHQTSSSVIRNIG